MDITDTRYIISRSLKEKSYNEKSIKEKKQLIDEAYKAYILYIVQFNKTKHHHILKNADDNLTLLELLDIIDSELDPIEEGVIKELIYCILMDAEFLQGWAIKWWEEAKESVGKSPTDIFNEKKYLYNLINKPNKDLIQIFRLIYETYFNEILIEDNIQKLILK